jgi:hypothetical protein
MAYCTQDDVLGVAVTFRIDIDGGEVSGAPQRRLNTNTIQESEMTDIIEEASNITRLYLSPRYSIEYIDSLGPDYPPVVVYFTKYQAALLMYERYASASTERNEKLMNIIEKTVQKYRTAIINGNVRDELGELITTLTDPNVLMQINNTKYPAMSELNELNLAGRTY